MDLHEELWGLVETYEERVADRRYMQEVRLAYGEMCCHFEALLTRHNVPRPRTCGECGNVARRHGDAPNRGICNPGKMPLWSKGSTWVDFDTPANDCPCFTPRDGD